LKGNLHTTDVMLSKNVDDVVIAAKKAIDDAAIDFADLAEDVMGNVNDDDHELS